jgi:streptogramin lyase
VTNGFGGQSGTQVVRIDPADEAVDVAFPSGNAKAIVVAFGAIWLADADRDQVLRYDPQNLSAGPTAIPIDDDAVADEAPRYLAAGAGIAEGIWVANELGDTVVRIDPESLKVGDHIQVEGPTGVAAGDSGIWVTSETLDRVHRFDAADRRALQTFEQEDGVLDGPTVIAVAPSGVWVGSDLESAIALIAPNATTAERLALDGIVGGLVVDVSGDVWVTVRAPL